MQGTFPSRPNFLASFASACRRLAGQFAWRDDMPREPRSSHTWLVLIVTGLGGGLLGAGTGLQLPVESAQVLAGLVKYPADNPFYMYHIKSWTILHQVCAVLLWGGLSERTVSVFLAGLVGMVSFQALALCALAVSHSRIVGVLAPILCFGTKFFDNLGGVYDI